MNLRSLRRQKVFLQKEVAEKIGVSKDYLSRIERGKVNLSIQMMRKLAKVYHVDLNQIQESAVESRFD